MSPRPSRGSALALAASLVLAGGCALPQGGDPAQAPEVQAIARTSGREKLGALAVAPVGTFVLARDEAQKGWKLAECPDLSPAKVREAAARALGATGSFDRVRAAAGDAFADAWRERDDLLASVSVDELATRYEGHNALWIPNMLNWLFWIVPAWFVPTEEYSLSARVTLTLASAESGTPVAPPATFTATASATFDEFDRGWQFFGFVSPTLDAEVWRNVATKLFPQLELEIAVGTARAAEQTLRAAGRAAALRDARRKTLALLVGVSRYEQALELPPLPHAADDARALAEVLAARGVKPEHLALVTDEGATVSAVKERVQSLLARARDGDSVLVAFAGYGSRRADGTPELVLHEATGTETGRIGLDQLAALLEPLAGQKLVIVDAGFGGRERSVRGGAAPQDEASDLAPLAKANVAAILAGGASDPALAPAHLGAGLLSHHVVDGLRGLADEDRDGRVTALELYRYARPRVLAEAALEGESERPRATGLERGWAVEGASPEGKRAP